MNSKAKPKVTMEQLVEAEEWLLKKGIDVRVTYVEVHIDETRQSPKHGQYNTNKGGTLLGATVSIDATKPDSNEILDKVVKALIAKVRRGSDIAMDMME